jgi:broad specificity phosphatase PhoE
LDADPRYSVGKSPNRACRLVDVTSPNHSTRLFIVRHGESNAQAEGFFSGHDTCTGLSPFGRKQVAALYERLAATGEFGEVAALYTSILPRAKETAGIIAPAFGDVPVQADCDFCEMHVGQAEGLSYSELQERFPTAGNPELPFGCSVPGCESWEEFYARVGNRLHRAALDHQGETIVVAGHGGTIAASFVALGGLSMAQSRAFNHETRNTSITEWRSDENGWWLVRFNDAAHLASLPAGGG